MVKLLLDEPPLVVLPSLAVAVGLNEALVLQQLHYWLMNARQEDRTANFKQGRWWVFNSYEAWQKTFPFWSDRTIQRTFLALEKMGLVLAAQLADDVRDRRKWYTIDYDAFREQVEKKASGPTVPTCPDAPCQVGTMDQDKLAPSTETDRQGGPRQAGTLFKGKTTAEKTAETSPKTTAAESLPSPPMPARPPAPSAAGELIGRLVGEGMNRSDAVRLAGEMPEECRRQLDYLPYHAGPFKSSKGAYLRTAIEQGFAPPPGWTEKQEREAAARRRKDETQEAQAARQEEEREAAELAAGLAARKEHLKRDAAAWQRILSEAEARLPVLLRGKPGHVAYGPALEKRIDDIVAAR